MPWRDGWTRPRRRVYLVMPESMQRARPEELASVMTTKLTHIYPWLPPSIAAFESFRGIEIKRCNDILRWMYHDASPTTGAKKYADDTWRANCIRLVLACGGPSGMVRKRIERVQKGWEDLRMYGDNWFARGKEGGARSPIEEGTDLIADAWNLRAKYEKILEQEKGITGAQP